MYERKKKPTLEQMRTLFPFDPAVLADQAAIPSNLVYHALIGRPILQKDAESLLAALSQHCGFPLSLEQVDLVVWEFCEVLWVVRASEHAGPEGQTEVDDCYHFVYARDREQAVTLVRPRLNHVTDLPYHFFTPYPTGLYIGDIFVPGRHQIDADK